jgi:hypothetical protein
MYVVGLLSICLTNNNGYKDYSQFSQRKSNNSNRFFTPA